MRAVVGIGSNIRPAENVAASLRLLAAAVAVRKLSSVYRTEPEGRPEQPMYYNCAAAIETDLSPEALRNEVLRPIEERLGRVRTADKFASRTIDLDLILYGNGEGRTFVVPEQEILRRPYLAMPLAEIEPGLTIEGGGPVGEAAKHPVTGKIDKLHDYSKTLLRELREGRAARQPGREHDRRNSRTAGKRSGKPA